MAVQQEHSTKLEFDDEGNVTIGDETVSVCHLVEQAVRYGVNLSGVDLSGVNLRHANLTDADLSGADLTAANLNDANMNDVKGLAS